MHFRTLLSLALTLSLASVALAGTPPEGEGGPGKPVGTPGISYEGFLFEQDGYRLVEVNLKQDRSVGVLLMDGEAYRLTSIEGDETGFSASLARVDRDQRTVEEASGSIQVTLTAHPRKRTALEGTVVLGGEERPILAVGRPVGGPGFRLAKQPGAETIDGPSHDGLEAGILGL